MRFGNFTMVPTSNLDASSPKAIWSDHHQGQTSYLSNLGPQIPQASQIIKGKSRAQHLGSSNSKVWKHFLEIEHMKNKCETNYCSFLELRFTCRVNMPSTEHHPVTEHTSCADQRWWMNALIFKSILTGTPSLENMCSAFLHFTPRHLILVHGFGHRKVHFQNNCVQFWVWVNNFF
jgi:hypothetical protein